MAIVTRRYRWTGANLAAIQNNGDPGSILPALGYTAFVDVTFNDAIASAIVVDTQMIALGYVFVTAAPVGVPSLSTAALQGYVSDLALSFGSVSTVSISAGRARSSDNTFDILVAAPLLVNIAVVGVNGLDAGVEAANTWYFVYVIGDSTSVNPAAGILSTSSVIPTFPAGYDRARRVGSVRNEGASNFRDFFVQGTDRYRSIQYKDNIGTRNVLASGAAVIATAVACATLIPPTSRYGRFEIRQSGTALLLIYGDAASGLVQRGLLGSGGNELTDLLWTTAGQAIGYANFGAGGLADIWVNGYEEAI